MASASGLPLLAPKERNPLLTTSRGTGEVIIHAMESGCREIILGIGGSATNDAGTGMLSALGYKFLDYNGNLLSGCGADLNLIASIDASAIHPLLQHTSFRVACDVNNPFYGPSGAAHTYAAQKGASPDDIILLENGMRHLAEIIKRDTGTDLQAVPGSGAAGGMGGGAFVFLNSRMQRGIELILDYLQFDSLICDADWVITGEGRADIQTLMGKAPLGVLEAASRQGIPVALFAGRIDNPELLLNAGFKHAFEISPENLPLETAMNPVIAKQNIRIAAKKFIALLNNTP